MKQIAFDVDGTLITKSSTGEDVPRYETIRLLMSLKDLSGASIFVWSGSGVDYAERWVQKLGISHYVTKVIRKGEIEPDIAFDDESVTLAKVNIQI